MRVLFLTLILLVPLSSNSFAMTNESLYKWCKPFADHAFEVEDSDDISCLAYITGAFEYADLICFTMSEAAEDNISSSFTRSYFGANADINNNAVIQAYVNKMKNEPENWEYSPNEALRQVFTEVAPCE